MYHRVCDVRSAAESRFAVTPERFAQHMRRLAGAGYRAVGIQRLVEWLDGGPPLHGGDFVLTFDDGYRDVLEHADPVLRELGWPYTVFLVTDLLGGVDAWNLRAGISGHPLLAADEVRQMHARGCDFQSHTRSHPSLPALDDAALRSELAGSRERLAELLGRAPDYLAYPFGHVDERVEAAARAAGYKAAFSVQPGFNRQSVGRYRLRRLDVFGSDTPARLLRKMRLGSNDGGLMNYIGYLGRRAGSLPLRLVRNTGS
ncbi:polysaccharide deacetylase [Rubrivivax gelatinosus]|nr:polysaccharide deacetylase [Rubrivivax gelatinosus]